jgi:hypothetical protein
MNLERMKLVSSADLLEMFFNNSQRLDLST